MKKLLIALVIGALSLIGISQSNAVFKIVGSQGACDTTFSGCNPIPLTPTQLCIAASCPLFAAPSYTNSLRVWGVDTNNTSCVTSTNGGSTWGTCTTQPIPFQSQLKSIASTGDGSVISIQNDTNTNTCTVRKSIDNAASWSDVYTDTSIYGACDTGEPTLKCLANGYCVFISFQSVPTTASIALISTNNGSSWTLTTLSSTVSFQIFEAVYDGSVGIGAPYVSGAGQLQKAAVPAWTVSGIWPDTSTNCTHSMILNSVGVGICYSSGETYDLRDNTGTLTQSIVIGGSYQGLGAGGFGISPITNVIYVAGLVTNIAGAKKLGIWASIDSGVTFTKIYTSSTNISVGNTTDGNMYYANGCVYVSAGRSGGIFVKVC